jgi:membrane protein implicated in regulation of membrane protease activity
METLLHWRTLVFVIPVVFGAVLALGAALGVLGDDRDAHDGHDDGEVLAFGRLPLTLRLMLLAFTFGGVGLVVGPGVWAFVPGETLGGLAAIAVATIGAAASTRALSQLVARQVPLLESETIRRAELVGRVGRVVVSTSTTSGAAHVRDARGNLHQIACHVDQFDSPVPAGTDVVLVDYHEQRRSFVVSASPFSERAATG